jgi:glycosyltransferase involved in cell wall biosynthesis
MRIGIAIEETWAFFKEIYEDLQQHHQVSLYERKTSSLPVFNTKLNRYLFDQGLQNFLRDNEVVFFEWASELLAAATHLPKTCAIVARLHRYEMYRWVDKINWDVVDRIIVVTDAKKNEFIEKFPEQMAKVVVIPEAVSLERFQPFEKTTRGDIGTLCNLIPRKRVYELILAFYELLKVNPNLHLHIAGPEHDFYREYASALYSLVRRLDLVEQVTFYGRVAEPEIWYRNLDIFVSNSYSEGLQVALLEAMACGIFSLSHAWEGADELLPADHLFYSEKEFVDRINHYLEKSPNEQSLIKNQMIALVAGKSDIQNTVNRIRTVLEEFGAPGERSNQGTTADAADQGKFRP